MKKIFLCLLITGVLLTGCEKKDNKKTEEASNILKLKGNPTTGYQWTCENKDDIISLNSKYEQDNKDTEISGAGGTYTFTLTGIKEGETTLTCTYKRNWEETEYDETNEYNVKVDKDLKVSYSEKK